MSRTGSSDPSRLALLFAALVFALATRAFADGAFPDEFSVALPAAAPQRILVGANFGIIVSEDNGATWRYACEPWVTEGSSDALSQEQVSFYQVTADAAVLALSVQITRSDDGECTWPPATGDITNQVVTDIFPDPTDANFVIAIIDISSGSYLLASHDGGRTFNNPPLFTTDALLTGVELSKSTHGVVYATSIALSGTGSTLLYSNDDGMSWTPNVVPAGAGEQPLILGVDPLDSATVYLRVVGAQSDSLVVTHDNGQHFSTLLSINGQFSSFLRAGDGTLYAGTIAGMLYTLPPGATVFTSAVSVHFRCLGQRKGETRIYACGDQGRDGFDLGYSDDNGQTWVPLMNFVQILGPLLCAPVNDNCQAHWQRIQAVLGIVSDAGPPIVDAGPDDAGVTDAGGPGIPDAGEPDAGVPDAGVTPPTSGGSSCQSIGGGAFALLGLWALQRTRRRTKK